MDTGWPSSLHKWLELAFTPCGSALLGEGFRFFHSHPEYWVKRHLCNARWAYIRSDGMGMNTNLPRLMFIVWKRMPYVVCSTVQYIDMAIFASTPLMCETCLVHKVPKDGEPLHVPYAFAVHSACALPDDLPVMT